MSLVCTPDLQARLSGANLLLDTCVLVDASKCSTFYEYLESLADMDCALLSLPSVKEELVCNANNLDDYRKLSAHINNLQIVLLNDTENKLVNEENAVFDIALSRCGGKNPSYVDRMLLLTMYYYNGAPENMYLMTANYKDVPRELFDRVGFIAYDETDVHTVSIYEFNNSRFKRMAQRISA